MMKKRGHCNRAVCCAVGSTSVCERSTEAIDDSTKLGDKCPVCRGFTGQRAGMVQGSGDIK